MANFLTPDDIDFAMYERETDAQQNVKTAAIYVQELIDRIKTPVKIQQAVMPWHKTHSLVQFRPGEVTVWGGGERQWQIPGDWASGFGVVRSGRKGVHRIV